MVDGTIKKTLDINYNLDYIVIVPKEYADSMEAFSFTFGNTILFNATVEDTEFFIKFLRKNTIGTIIFVDYYAEYEEMISTLVDELDIKFICTSYLGQLSDEFKLGKFNKICAKYDSGAIDGIGFLDYNLYRCVHSKMRNTMHVLLDTNVGEKAATGEGNRIGILNSDSSDYESYYNELCSFTFLPGYTAKLLNPTAIAKSFIKEYKIKAETVNCRDTLFDNNSCNLDINFSGSSSLDFIKSMDAGIPCVVGNNAFLTENYPLLCENLVVKSDDDVNEIAEIVKKAVKNKEKIMREYKKFRKHYSNEARKKATEFIGKKIVRKEEREYEKLLTVIVPVYNTEQFIAGCLDSVISAAVPGMEIIVVNDGSTDNSKKVIEEYKNKYPDLIIDVEQKNHGLGNVRNVGLKRANGKYITSVDSDDTIASETFKKALLYMLSDTDVIIYDWMSVTDQTQFETVAFDQVFSNRKEWEGLLYTTIMPSTCNKIFKTSLFVDNDIKYLEQKYEDLSANPLALLRADTIKYIKKPYYNYYLRDNSLMRSKINPNHMVDALVYLDKRMQTDNDNINMGELKYYTYSWRIEEYIINPLYEMKDKDLEEAINYIYKNAYSLIMNAFECKYYKKMLKNLKSDEMRAFIEKRNVAFKNKKLKDFIKKSDAKKITAGVIYYGD